MTVPLNAKKRIESSVGLVFFNKGTHFSDIYGCMQLMLSLW